MTDVWTVDRVEALRKMWGAGATCSEIAKELACGVTRNAVIGKVTRLKLPPRGRGVQIVTERSATPRKAKPGKISSLGMTPTVRRNQSDSLADKLAIAGAEPGIPARLKGEKPDGTGIQIRDLTELNCHWPKGDPLEADFEFCGAVAIPGMPYCAGHCRLAFTPATARRREPEELRPRLNSARQNNFYLR